jgi:hypothetical protein
MAGDNDKNKKGFSGLSHLASEVSGIDEPVKPEPKTAVKSSAPKQTSQPQRETASTEREQRATSSPPPVETVSSDQSGGNSGGIWILVGILMCVVAFVIFLVSNGGQSNKAPSYSSPSSSQSYSYPQSNPDQAVQTPSATQSADLQYTKPSVGTNKVLSVPEIRWCVREGIRIDAMRDVIDTYEGIDEFNRIVDDCNSRCGRYWYRLSSQSRAERDVEPYRSQIVSEAIREARQLGRSYQPSYP